VVVPDDGPLPTVRLGAMRLTLIAPGWKELARLEGAWPEAVIESIEPLRDRPLPPGVAPTPLAELIDSPYSPDRGETNGSSIAFIAEHDAGGRILFAADAPAETLLAGVRRVGSGGVVSVDLCKVPHHGSRHNVSRELVAALDCRNWLFSTSGARHGHPHRAAIARIVSTAGQVLWFNYHSLTTEEFADATVADRFEFRSVHADPLRPGLVLSVTGRGVDRVT
jgi:hypothetical protein